MMILMQISRSSRGSLTAKRPCPLSLSTEMTYCTTPLGGLAVNFGSKTMDFATKVMDFVLKLMDLVWNSRRLRGAQGGGLRGDRRGAHGQFIFKIIIFQYEIHHSSMLKMMICATEHAGGRCQVAL